MPGSWTRMADSNRNTPALSARRLRPVKSNFDRILSSEDVMRRRATLLQRMHIDGPLLILLLTLAAGSLFVLYSASGKSWDLLAKQATSFGIGLVSMVVIAQFEPRFMARDRKSTRLNS